MQSFSFPLTFTYTAVLANRLLVTDADGRTGWFIKQLHHDVLAEASLLNLDPFIDEITVFKDASEAEKLYTIKAVPWKNFTASFGFLDKQGNVLGYVARVTWVPELPAHYQVFDAQLHKVFEIREGAGIVRFKDTVLGKIPFLGLSSGLFFNPTYHVLRKDDRQIAMLKKEKSLFSRKFTVNTTMELTAFETEQVLLSLLVITIQERRRG